MAAAGAGKGSDRAGALVSVEHIGYWKTDAPLTPEQITADEAVLRQITIPDSVTILSMDVYVDGHLWTWRSERVRTL